MLGTVIRSHASARIALIRHPDGRCSVVEWGEDARLHPGDLLELSAEDASYGTVRFCETGQLLRSTNPTSHVHEPC